jgi:hypothetical protein
VFTKPVTGPSFGSVDINPARMQSLEKRQLASLLPSVGSEQLGPNCTDFQEI